ncbi:MAG: hypothetical protein WCK41_02300 [Actinomycetes bacterium]
MPSGDRPNSDPPKLRLALTLPGAVSLGSYHGGALAALVIAAQNSGGQIVIDAMATASAGSITGVLAARALLNGCDPVALMTSAWVEADSLRNLRSSDTTSVLSAEPLVQLAADLLDVNGSVPDGGTDTPRQAEPIHISMALASLGGLSYQIPSIDRDLPPFQALTHLDWWSARFSADGDASQFLAATKPALASAANALGFPPILLDRSSDRETYIANHVLNVPADDSAWQVWYTDGGTLDDQPFGRAIELVNVAESAGDIPTLEGDDVRLFLLVEPQPATIEDTSRWWNPDHRPAWTFTLFDVFNLKGSQSIYDDLRKLEKTNSHVRWTAAACETITNALQLALSALGDLDADRRSEVESAIAAALGESLTTMVADRHLLDTQRASVATEPQPQPLEQRPPPSDDLAKLLHDLVHRASGLQGKRRAQVEMVSPLLDGDSPPIADRLAGDFLFHFGGFVDEDFRKHDFLVGWNNMRTWLAQRASQHGFEPALDAVDKRRRALGWRLKPENPSLGSLPLGDKWQLTRAAAHVGRVISHDIIGLLGDDEPASG